MVPRNSTLRRRICALLLLAITSNSFTAAQTSRGSRQPLRRPAPPQVKQPGREVRSAPVVPHDVLLRIVEHEDRRRWDSAIESMMADGNPAVRWRAALAAGRIGDERAIEPLLNLLRADPGAETRAMAAFALGQLASPRGIEGLAAALAASTATPAVQARIIEAIGKISAALPRNDETHSRIAGDAILGALRSHRPAGAGAGRSRPEVVLAALTAALRAHPANAADEVKLFLADTNARVRADAANTLARLRAKNAGPELRARLLSDPSPEVRANAARALGAAEDQAAFEVMVERAVRDTDERVRVSSIRALAAIRDPRAAEPLLRRAASLFQRYLSEKTAADTYPADINEMLEIASALGRVLGGNSDQRAISWLRQFRAAEEWTAPEVEIAFARVAPGVYLSEFPLNQLSADTTRKRLHSDWRIAASLAQGLGSIAASRASAEGNSVVGWQVDAQFMLRALSDDPELPAFALSEVLRALAAFKPNDIGDILRKRLDYAEVMVRATSAELIGELPADELNERALAAALSVALRDPVNDAALSILDSLAKQKTAAAFAAIQTALDSGDYLVRRRAVGLLKAAGAGDFSQRLGTVASRNTIADYERALGRQGKLVRALVSTDKGSFTIELLPESAPLTVDNFVLLASHGFFNNLRFHRVVPNFVIQDGDPRGDGNGGPGYQIRDEINEVPYDRGAVGMALSGKDTGGSQWFVTHSAQPHLDGGYTVFGRVVAGLDVVDRIARGDRIRRLTITEGPREPAARQAAPR